MATLTVRQVGQVAPPLKQKIEQFQQAIDNNDQSVARIREQLRSLEPQRERLSDLVQQRQDDKRNIHSQLARLEDSLATFAADSAPLEATIEEMPRLLERVSVPVSQQAMAGAGTMDPSGIRRMPAAAIEVPLPYFGSLAEQLELRAQQVYERVNSVEKALATYNRQASGVPLNSQIEAVVRSEHMQFRAIAAELAQAGERIEQLREAAVRTRGVPVGMLARPADDSYDQRNAARGPPGVAVGGHLLGSLAISSPALGQIGGCGGMLGGQPMGACGGGGLFGAPANTGGGLFGAPANTGGGLFGAPANTGGGLFGAPANTGGGLFGAPANTGGGLFGAPASTGGGLFGAPANTGGGLFGAPANTGGGLFGAPANTGGGLFGANTGGGLFGGAQSSGGGLFGANTGGGLFGGAPANTGGGLFGANTGGGLFGGAQSSGGGLFGGANTGGGLFGGAPANTGGGLFGANTGGGLFGGAQSSGGGLFGGANTGGGLFGGAQSSGGGLFGGGGGGGLFGASTGGGLFGK